MIVKNEQHVMGRCLASVLPLLDSWLVVDTGSTDATQELIRESCSHLPGELIERPWVDFAHNRTEALQYAAPRADFLLIIDADEVLEQAADFRLPDLQADAYDFELVSGTVLYYKTQLVRSSLEWRFEGVVHEYITTEHPVARQRLAGVRTLRIPDGARSRDPLTYRKDALLLEEALLKAPLNTRHMFYLAQSYLDAGELQQAQDRYTRRVGMGGWDEEVWSSLYQIARIKEMRALEWPEVLAAYLQAFQFRPARAEPLFRIGIYYQARHEYALAYLFFMQAASIPLPVNDVLFVEQSVYTFFLPLEYAVASYYVGRHREAVEACDSLLLSEGLTAEQREQVLRNRQFSLDAAATESVEMPFPTR
ncbi:MAG: tetratricopeptide repeat-containing glycosyltransferase [Janthinobacterium lividum]